MIVKFLLVFVFLISSSNLSAAGSVHYISSRKSPDCVESIGILGPIKIGDSAEFEKIVNQAKQKKCQNFFTSYVSLSSPGGNVSESLKIGKILRNNELYTEINNGDSCLSSCVFIFIAGVSRSAGLQKSVGIHRPYFDNLDPNLSLKEVKIVMDRLNAEIFNYLVEMEVSTRLYDEMMLIPSTSMRYLDAVELAELSMIFNAPSYDEKRNAEAAYLYGMSSGEYRFAYANAHSVCDRNHPKNRYASTAEEIEPFHACILSQLKKIPQDEAEKRRNNSFKCFSLYSEKKSILDCKRNAYAGKNK